MHITIIATGSRGDIQPMVAPGCGLKAAGHAVRLGAPETFASFVREHGLEFAPVSGDVRARLAAAITAAMTDDAMIRHAAEIGQCVREEDGRYGRALDNRVDHRRMTRHACNGAWYALRAVASGA